MCPVSSYDDRAAGGGGMSVIVPATDDPSTLPACLEALRVAAPEGAEVVVVREPARTGPAAARNAGVRTSCGELLVFVDADVLVHEDALGRIAAAFADDAGLVALFGSYDDRPAASGVVSRFRNLLHHHVHQSSAGPAGTFWSGLGAVRRDAFEAVGGFDAERFAAPAVEDIDLGLRLAAEGGRIVLDPLVQGTHLKRWTLRSMVRTDFVARGVPWTALLLRHRAAAGALNLGWRHRLSALCALAMAIAALTGRLRMAGAAGASFVALGAPFYALLMRRTGPGRAAAGVGLHALHHLTAVASIPVGVIVHLRERRR
jgi:glycosyltransferase involved in cell wall biosynthesis